MRRFTYLYTRSDDSQDSKCNTWGRKDGVEASFESSGITGGFLTRNESSREYVWWPDPNMFYNHMVGIEPSQRQFHEVIMSGPQKIKFDIDIANRIDLSARGEISRGLVEIAAALPEIDMPNLPTLDDIIKWAEREPIMRILQCIIDAISDIFILMGVNVTLSVYESVYTDLAGCFINPAWEKFSFHIIVNELYVETPAVIREITKELIGMVPKTIRGFIDIGVNKSTQNFRMLGNCKRDGLYLRMKIADKLVPSRDEFMTSLITNIDGCKLFSMELGTACVPAAPITCDQEMILREICSRVQGHSVRKIHRGIVVFDRLAPSHCEFCDRVHHKDNTLMVHLSPEQNSIWMRCRKTPGKAIRLGSYTQLIDTENTDVNSNGTDGITTDKTTADKTTADKSAIGNTADTPKKYGVSTRIIERAISDQYRDSMNLFLREECNIYTERELREFELAHTLFVHANMKMGKTKGLISYLQKYYADTTRPRICIVSFRQTFSSNIIEKFPGFVLYSDITGPITSDKIIIQVESLHRLNVGDPYDLVICDESESIFEQFDSGLLRQNFNQSFAVFKWLMQYSAHAIFLDAIMTARTYNIVAHLRYGKTTYSGIPPVLGSERHRVVYHRNEYRNAHADKYYITPDRVQWFSEISKSIGAGQRVVIMSNSLDIAKTAWSFIREKFPDRRVQIYSSETTPAEKREHFADVNHWWQQYDIIIYTPTITAGVSFEVAHFHKVFCYFTDMSCNTQTCIQMIGRTRAVLSHEYVICIAASGNNLPTTIDKLKFWLYSNRMNLLGENVYVPEFTYDESGNVTFYTSDYLYVYLQNLIMRNESRNWFTRQLIGRIGATGATIIRMDADSAPDSAADAVSKEIAAARQRHKKISAEEIAAAEDIPDDIAEKLQLKSRQQSVELTRADYCELARWRLRRYYDYTGDLTADYIQRYDDRNVRVQYRNLRRIYAAPTPREALAIIQREESAHYNITMQSYEYQSMDISRQYSYTRHKLVMSWVEYLGFESIISPGYVNIDTMVKQTLINIENFRREHRMACTEFEHRHDAGLFLIISPVTIISIVKFINFMLKKMYGFRIACGRDGKMFHIILNKLFTLRQDMAGRLPLLRRTPGDNIGNPADVANANTNVANANTNVANANTTAGDIADTITILTACAQE